MKKQLKGVDLFCGCGGFSLGFIQAGWDVVAALDSDPQALATYWYNLGSEETKIIGTIPHRYAKYFNRGTFQGLGYRASTKPKFPPVKVLFCKSILDVNGWEIMEAAGVDHVEVVFGSPPCGSFSTMNQRKKKKDFRDFLVFEFGRVILEIIPDTYVMENVPAMIRRKLPDGRNLVRVFNEMMEKRDWDIYYDVQGMFADIPPDKDSVSPK